MRLPPIFRGMNRNLSVSAHINRYMFRLSNTVMPCLFLIFFSRPVFSDDLLDLRLNLGAGDRYTCHMDMTNNVVQTIDGEDQSLEQRLRIDWLYEIESRDENGVMDLDMTYERVWISQDFGHQTMEYDSDNPPSYVEPPMRAYEALVGSTLRVRVDDKGKVLQISGVPELIDRIISKLDIPDSQAKERALADIREQFGEKALENSIQQITAFYPPKAVAVGESWESHIAFASGFPMSASNDYTLVSRDSRMARISLTSDISAGPDSSGIQVGEANIYYDISGSQNGTIDIDETSGLPLRSEINMEFAGNVVASGVPDQPSGTWPIRATGKAIVTFEKD